MSIFPSWRGFRQTRALLRNLSTCAQQLTRIADALERAYPVQASALDPATPQGEVETPDPLFQAQAEYIAREFYRTHGRLPDADEIMTRYGQIQHLLPTALRES